MTQQQSTDVAKQEAREVAESANQRAHELGDTVKSQASEVAGEMYAQGREVFERTKESLREQSEIQAQEAASRVRQLAEQSRALAEGRPEESGPVQDYVRQASERLDDFASRVEQRGAQGVIDDVEDFARRRPGVFLAGAAGLGFFVGRMLRGAAASGGGSSNGRTNTSTYEPNWPPPVRGDGV